jgi:hypothetical protein
MSELSQPSGRERDRPADAVAGVIATVALAMGLISIVYKPVRVAPVALVVALIAAAMGGRHERLAAWAVGVISASWVLGMIYAIVADKPLW